MYSTKYNSTPNFITAENVRSDWIQLSSTSNTQIANVNTHLCTLIWFTQRVDVHLELPLRFSSHFLASKKGAPALELLKQVFIVFSNFYLRMLLFFVGVPAIV